MQKIVENYRGYNLVDSWGEFEVHALMTKEQRRAGTKPTLLARAPSIEDVKDYVDYLVAKQEAQTPNAV